MDSETQSPQLPPEDGERVTKVQSPGKPKKPEDCPECRGRGVVYGNHGLEQCLCRRGEYQTKG